MRTVLADLRACWAGLNGNSLLRVDGSVATAFAVQKSNLATWRHWNTRADEVCAVIERRRSERSRHHRSGEGSTPVAYMRMSDTEAIMWAVEKDPALRSDFCNLTILEGVPDAERMQHTMARAVAAIPRLGQRVVGAPLRIVPPAFADDPTLDLSAHVRRMALPGDGSERALLDLCGALAEQPLDRARPLWEFTIIEGLDDGRAALLQKIHHTITDGVGGSASRSRSSTSIPTPRPPRGHLPKRRRPTTVRTTRRCGPPALRSPTWPSATPASCNLVWSRADAQPPGRAPAPPTPRGSCARCSVRC